MHSHNPPKQCIAIKELLWNQNQKVAILFLHNTSFLQICFCRRGITIRKGGEGVFLLLLLSQTISMLEYEEKKFKQQADILSGIYFLFSFLFSWCGCCSPSDKIKCFCFRAAFYWIVNSSMRHSYQFQFVRSV